jgi:hypothetical protein
VAGRHALIATSWDSRPFDPSFHHASHRHLLSCVQPKGVSPASVDALIVPTARPVRWLSEAMRLARRLNCGLVAMCSRAVQATEVVDLGDQFGVSVIAIDVTNQSYGLPKLLTTELLSRKVFARRSDTALKRNMALLISRMAGWERIFFLDDDIVDIDFVDVRTAAVLLDNFDAIGMHNVGFPDNSVVCHVYREIGADQAEFIGAGALAVDPLARSSFFPNIYNQDWLFILGYGQPANVAITGQMSQREYDPFADSSRARREELGDCIGEGLYWLLDHGSHVDDADFVHWRDFIDRRAYFIDYLVRKVRRRDWADGREERIIASLRVARSTLAHVTPGLCASFVSRWQADLATWRRFVDERPVGLGVEKALEELNWPGVVRSASPWPVHAVDGYGEEDRLTC